MELIPYLLVALFVVLFVSVAVWLLTCYRLFKRLEQKHPVLYEEMGRPTLMRNNDLGTNFSLLQFIRQQQWRGLNDSELTSIGLRLAWMLPRLTILFVLLFGGAIGFGIYSDMS